MVAFIINYFTQMFLSENNNNNNNNKKQSQMKVF